MGRTISAAHRDELIAYWDERLRGCAPTGLALRRLLCPGEAGRGNADADTARRFTRAAAALRAADGTAARRAWIDRFLVTRGPDLLVDERRRRAALTTVRDRARRNRRKAADRHVVQVVLGTADLRTLRSHAQAIRCNSLSDAIVHLIRKSVGVRPRAGKTSSDASTPDLFSAPKPGGPAEPPARRDRASRHKP